MFCHPPRPPLTRQQQLVLQAQQRRSRLAQGI